MEIKGYAVRSIPEFVEKQFPARFQEWLDALPEESKKIMRGLINSGNWYPIKVASVIPLKVISRLFYDGDDIRTALTIGRFGADFALTGIYKFFIQFGSPRYIIERGGRVFDNYYRPTEIAIVNSKRNNVIMHITKFPEPDEITEYTIVGWIQRALEITGCKNVNIEITKSLSRNDEVTEFDIHWA